MDRGNTKQEILEAALELFSVQGFEATSISQIANAVGIRKASLYSHFESKQAILDTLLKEVLEQYGGHSIFSKVNWEDNVDNLPLTDDQAVRMIQGQIRYILHDPIISRARKMLVIEHQTELFRCDSVFHRACEATDSPRRAVGRGSGNYGSSALSADFRVA